MRFRSASTFRLLTVVALSVVLLGAPAIAAQKVPISFDKYHGYTGTTNYVQSVAKAYPNITKLLKIGESTMGRPIHVLVISNMKTGTTIDQHVTLRNMRKEGVKNVNPMQPYQGKSGYWISGATHGNEFTGSEVCLYIVDKLVSAYGSDEKITRLIDTKTFYICPMVNPDGVYNSIEKGISQRQNSMLLDDDGDGRINEDGWDDINGDGKITQFRYPSKTGRYVMDDEDPRVMVRLGAGQKTEKPRYAVVMEDIDNDKDGKTGEDSERGIDLNRNYPEGWAKEDNFAGGSGDYPTSAPETRAIAEFFTNHTNILIGQNYHTSGGFTFRPMGTAPHPSLHPKDVAVLDFVMGKKYLEIIGEEVPEAWQKPEKLDDFKAELKKTSKNKYAIQRGYELPRGWRVSYNEANDQRYSYGMATDWMYMQQGAFAVCTELWNPSNDIPGFPEVAGGRRDPAFMRELVKFQDANYGGKLFVPWKKFKHPELGDGEVGGFISIYGNNAWPGEPLLKVCEDHWQFELFRAGLLPEVELGDVTAKVLYTTNSAKEATAAVKGDEVTIKKGGSKGKFKVVEVTAQIRNSGKLATHVARGERLAGLRQDVVWLLGDRDKVTYLQGTTWQQLGVLEGTMKIPGYSGEGMQSAPSQQQQFRRRQIYPPGYPMPQFRFGGSRLTPTQVRGRGPSRTVNWLVAVEGNTPLKVVVSSQKGGTKVKNVRVD